MGFAGTLSSDQLHFFNSQGYLVIESYSRNEEVEGLRNRMDELLHGFDPSSSASVFSTKNQRQVEDDLAFCSACGELAY
ncbi:phytanoyl-CoA dioxygenase [Tanacetum coccineum]